MKCSLPSQLAEAFVPRPADASKYTVGTVAVVGGSCRYPHAPVIAGLGARAAGAGLVSLVVPDASRICAGALLPEATFYRSDASFADVGADVTVAGMGMGREPDSEAVVSRLLSETKERLVLDADALFVLAEWQRRCAGWHPAAGLSLVLTPHEGEAARLLGCRREDVSADRNAAAREIAARYGATVVLKGANTLVVSPDGSRVYENSTGNPFMALGGMGDLLSGVIGARWAYLKGDPFIAAASSAWLHGAAADGVVAAGREPTISNTAAEIGAMRITLDV